MQQSISTDELTVPMGNMVRWERYTACIECKF